MTDGPKRVLVAEDNAAMRGAVCFALERAGMMVTPAASGQAAWDAMVESGADLVVTDYQMPGLTGGELCERMRKDPRFSQTPVVLLTGSGIELNLAYLRDELSVAAVVSKPFSPRELTETVQDCLAAATARA